MRAPPEECRGLCGNGVLVRTTRVVRNLVIVHPPLLPATNEEW
jgi:hypothetical protein